MPQTTVKASDTPKASLIKPQPPRSAKEELNLVCEDDGLSPAQKLIYSEYEEQEKAYKKELELYNKNFLQMEKANTTAEMSVSGTTSIPNGSIIQTHSLQKIQPQPQLQPQLQPQVSPQNIIRTFAPKKTIVPSGTWQPQPQVAGSPVITNTIPVNTNILAPPQVVPTLVNAVNPASRAVIQVPVGTDLTRMQLVSVPNSNYQFMVPSVNLQGLNTTVVPKTNTQIIHSNTLQMPTPTVVVPVSNKLLTSTPNGSKSTISQIISTVSVASQKPTKESGPSKQPQQANSTPGSAKRSATTTEIDLPKNKRPKVENENESVAIWERFYGWKQGRSRWDDEKPKGSMRCVICNKKLANNIRYMQHIRHHFEKEQQQAAAAKKQVSCRTCLRMYTSAPRLQRHIEKMHKACEHRCGICETPFSEHLSLMQHLAKMHKPLQMPYVCGLCKYMTSVYDDLVNHFNRLHEGGKALMCPFCVRILKCNNDYVRHFKSHMTVSIKNGIYHCRSCKLMFLNNSMLKEHVESDHRIYRICQRSGVPKWPSSKYEDKHAVTSSAVWPSSKYDDKPPVTSSVIKSQQSKPAPVKISPSLWTWREIVKPKGGLRCMECGIVADNYMAHFRMRMACNLCKYTTYCGTAFANHMIAFHKAGSAPKLHRITKTVVSNRRLLLGCSKCEFSTLSPTLMACHIECCPKGGLNIESFKVKMSYIHSSRNFRPEILAVRVNNNKKKPDNDDDEVIVIEEEDLVDLTDDQPGTSKTATSETQEVGQTKEKSQPQVKLEKNQTDSVTASDSHVTDGKVEDARGSKASENLPEGESVKVPGVSPKIENIETLVNDNHRSEKGNSQSPEDMGRTSPSDVSVKQELDIGS